MKEGHLLTRSAKKNHSPSTPAGPLHNRSSHLSSVGWDFVLFFIISQFPLRPISACWLNIGTDTTSRFAIFNQRYLHSYRPIPSHPIPSSSCLLTRSTQPPNTIPTVVQKLAQIPFLSSDLIRLQDANYFTRDQNVSRLRLTFDIFQHQITLIIPIPSDPKSKSPSKSHCTLHSTLLLSFHLSICVYTKNVLSSRWCL